MSIWYNLVAPGEYQLLLSPDPDEGSPTGCLRWSPKGGEVTHMCHTSRGGCEPLMVVPVLCLAVLDGSRMAVHLQVFQVVQQDPIHFLVDCSSSRGSWSALQHPGWLRRVPEWSEWNWMFLGKSGGVWTSGGHV